MAKKSPVVTGDVLKLRKERVHSTMLVEVLALMIFMSMAFAFVLRDEAANTNVWKQRHDKVFAELKAAKNELMGLRREVSELERANRQLLRSISGTIPANDTLTITRDQWKELIQRLANAEAVVRDQQGTIAGLTDRLNGKGGTDLPNCPVSPTDFIVRIDLSQSGFRVTPRWPASAGPEVARVPGLLALVSGRTLSTGEFRSYASQVRAWGRRQTVPCNFRAEVSSHHENMRLYKAQQNAVNETFYAAYR